MSTAAVETLPTFTDSDRDRFAHIVPRAAQMRGYVNGEEIVALCGKRFVPTRDPDLFDVCPTCRERLAEIRARCF